MLLDYYSIEPVQIVQYCTTLPVLPSMCLSYSMHAQCGIEAGNATYSLQSYLYSLNSGECEGDLNRSFVLPLLFMGVYETLLPSPCTIHPAIWTSSTSLKLLGLKRGRVCDVWAAAVLMGKKLHM